MLCYFIEDTTNYINIFPSLPILLTRLNDKKLLPAIFFIFSRAGCDQAAETISNSFKGPRDPTVDIDSLNGTIAPEVVGAHLTWLDTLLLAADQDSTIDHIIVQGHAPVLSPVRMQQTSGMILRDRELSPFWNALRQYDHQSGGTQQCEHAGGHWQSAMCIAHIHRLRAVKLRTPRVYSNL